MRRAPGERGQILPIVALALVVLLGISAFAIDVGYAYYAKRQLQSATDAAALAGAQDLPDATTAITTAKSYALENTPANLSSFTFTYQTRCTAAAVIATGCTAAVNPNALVVSGTASTNTWFAKIFGLDHFDVAAHANACSPCSSTPVDIVVAIDRTGSMCLDPDERTHNCADMNNAKAGVRTMLSMMNPPYAQIGMVAFPPLPAGTTDMCSAPPGNPTNFTAYDNPNAVYLNDQISSNYKAASSGLQKHTVSGDGTCIKADGFTSYSEALRQAKKELDTHGRANVPDYIVFLTDGEANIGSVYGVNDPLYPPDNFDDQHPCQSAIDAAKKIKDAGVTIYSIGYALSNKPCTAGGWETIEVTPAVPYQPAVPAVWNKKRTKIIRAAIPAVPAQPAVTRPCDPARDGTCTHSAKDHDETGMYSDSTLTAIASPGDYQQTDGNLSTIFAAIATDIGSGSSRLVDDGF